MEHSHVAQEHRVRMYALTLAYTPYSAHMSPENTHKHMGFYMEDLILGDVL